MAIHLDQIVPLGRTMAEYAAMFDLRESDRRNRILGCGDGPAIFNAEWCAGGGRVVSVDPLYRHTAPAIRQRIDATFTDMTAQVSANRKLFVWRSIPSLTAWRSLRRQAIDRFLADYADPGASGRYVAGELPDLPFTSGAFDLALCSHLLFLYSEQLSYAFHLAAMRELLRVAREVRVFPLLTLAMQPSPHLPPLVDALTCAGFRAGVERVPYEFQRGGNEMLRVAPVGT